jgi:hypothetical protein
MCPIPLAPFPKEGGKLKNLERRVVTLPRLRAVLPKEKKLKKGFETPTPEIHEAWGNWFASIADKIVDSGNPFGAAREITQAGSKELPLGLDSITGYSIINAENLDEAEEIAKTCPIITGIRVYEAMSM